MSVAAISAGSTPTPGAPASPARPARAADGDYKTANLQSSQTKDNNGDYKPLTSPAAAQSSPAVQASLTSLKVGG
jgi:hypothetical protein